MNYKSTNFVVRISLQMDVAIRHSTKKRFIRQIIRFLFPEATRTGSILVSREFSKKTVSFNYKLGARREFYGNFYHTYCGNLVFYGHSGDFCHICLCFYYACGNRRHTEYRNNSHTIDFHTVLYFVLYTIVNFATQCSEIRHTYIANFATLIHTKKKLIRCVTIFTILYGNYYPPHGEFKLICIGKFARRT